jgi:hypothetical protein
MDVIRRAWQRCLALFRKGTLDSDFDEEARSHIALAVEDFVQRGMSLPDAQRRARLKFGSPAAAKDAHRDSRGLPGSRDCCSISGSRSEDCGAISGSP